MKLRIKGNSIRLRLLQTEVAALVETGKLSEQIEFGNAITLNYTLDSTGEAENISAYFTDREIIVRVPKKTVGEWAESDRVSLEAEQETGAGGTLKILIEKDFVCLSRNDDPDNRDAFPNPNVN